MDLWHRMNWLKLSFYKLPTGAFNLGFCRFLFCLLVLIFVKFRVTYFSGLPEIFWFPNGVFSYLPFFAPPIDLSYLVVLYYLTGFLACIGLLSNITLPLFALAATLCFGYEYNFVFGASAKSVLILALWLIAFSRSGDGFSTDEILRKLRRGPKQPLASTTEYSWPIAAVRIYVVFIWTASGLQKVLISGSGWLSGNYLQNLFTSELMPGYWAEYFGMISSSTVLCQLISWVVIGFEILSVAVLFKRTRNFMVIGQILFTIFNSVVFGTRLHTWLFLNVFLFDFSYLSSIFSRFAEHLKVKLCSSPAEEKT